MHPFFYNSDLGWVPKDTITNGSLEIGHDAWIGERVIITPRCRRIGIGAVIGAASVVTKDIPDFAVVVGNPARIIKYRFSKEVCRLIKESLWWERSAKECVQFLPEMTTSIGDNPWRHPLFAVALRPTEKDSSNGRAVLRPSNSENQPND
jgi:hypothetical protein